MQNPFYLKLSIGLALWFIGAIDVLWFFRKYKKNKSLPMKTIDFIPVPLFRALITIICGTSVVYWAISHYYDGLN